MLDCDAICRGQTHWWRSLLVFDAWFWCYLSLPEVLWKVMAYLWCLILMLYVVFQSTWPFYCLPSMLDFDAICRGRMYFWRSVRAFRSWLWTLFVVAGHRLFFHVFFQKSTLNAICRGPMDFWSSLLAFRSWLLLLFYLSSWPCFPSEVDFECYLLCLELPLEVQSVIFNIFLWF